MSAAGVRRRFGARSRRSAGPAGCGSGRRAGGGRFNRHKTSREPALAARGSRCPPRALRSIGAGEGIQNLALKNTHKSSFGTTLWQRLDTSKILARNLSWSISPCLDPQGGDFGGRCSEMPARCTGRLHHSAQSLHPKPISPPDRGEGDASSEGMCQIHCNHLFSSCTAVPNRAGYGHVFPLWPLFFMFSSHF